MSAPLRNDRAHQLRLLRACWDLDQTRETLLESTKLFPEVPIGTICINPSMAVTAYTAMLQTKINLLLSLIEGEEGIDYPAESTEGEKA